MYMYGPSYAPQKQYKVKKILSPSAKPELWSGESCLIYCWQLWIQWRLFVMYFIHYCRNEVVKLQKTQRQCLLGSSDKLWDGRMEQFVKHLYCSNEVVKLQQQKSE